MNAINPSGFTRGSPINPLRLLLGRSPRRRRRTLTKLALSDLNQTRKELYLSFRHVSQNVDFFSSFHFVVKLSNRPTRVQGNKLILLNCRWKNIYNPNVPTESNANNEAIKRILPWVVGADSKRRKKDDLSDQFVYPLRCAVALVVVETQRTPAKDKNNRFIYCLTRDAFFEQI